MVFYKQVTTVEHNLNPHPPFSLEKPLALAVGFSKDPSEAF